MIIYLHSKALRSIICKNELTESLTLNASFKYIAVKYLAFSQNFYERFSWDLKTEALMIYFVRVHMRDTT